MTVASDLAAAAESLARDAALLQSPLTTAALTVADGQSLSGAVNCGNRRPVGVIFPADMKGLTSITALMVSIDGSTYVTMTYDDNEALDAIDVSEGESTYWQFPASYLKLFTHFKLQFGQAASGAFSATVVLG